MESVKLEPNDIQPGKPRIISTTKVLGRDERYINQISSIVDFEFVPPSSVINGQQRIYRTIPGVEGHENLPKPFFSMQQMLKTWDNFNSDLYRVICEIKDINE